MTAVRREDGSAVSMSESQLSPLYPPPAAFKERAHIKTLEEYQATYQRSISDPEAFWAEQANSLVEWFKAPTQILDRSKHPFYEWFADGLLNVSYNCLDRHLATRGDKTAILFEGEPGDQEAVTYRQLHEKVCRLANVLKGLGVTKGDRVCLYMPMIPELPVAMLACARVGATHSIVFGGFSAEALAARIQDAEAKVVITADGGWRRGKVVPLKAAVDEAIAQCPSVEKVICVRRCDNDVAWDEAKDLWYEELVAAAEPTCEAVPLEAEHPLFILYTSGTTGKPKGVVHTSGGYLVGTTLTTKLVFDLQEDDVYWCTADIGWVTGHSYVCYGPLSNGGTAFMYEGAPDTPNWERFWDMIQRHKITILYTAPTAIRAFMKQGEEPVKKHDLSTLRLLGSVGEPINPAAWEWYHRVIGGERCPIVDTWWQTETGAIMITPLPGVTATVPGSATRPFYGVDAVIVDEDGAEVAEGESGLLVIRQPWPSMLRTIYGDPDRYVETYWRRFGGKYYFAGDGARYDEQKYVWITGRVDDVLNVSGHRLGTAEVESALVAHVAVAEAAVVGFPHEIKGEGIAAFVSLGVGFEPSDDLKKSLVKHVRTQIGAIAQPDQIHFTASLPKTRSGKIMRRLLRDIAGGKETTGDTSTLEDLTVLAKLRTSDDE
ncbi:MAG: acetate--CoA ligase [Armatimonadetes bacterium]|nr:acetate--CoA ligase [Armatimonadota bacterium]